MKTGFPCCAPCEADVREEGIRSFVEALGQNGLELHAFMLIRGGKCLAKGCFHPYKMEDLHPVFSFSKSLTAAGIGFAVQEGLLSLTDHVLDYLGDYCPDPVSENLAALQIRHLLSMTCGQADALDGTLSREEDWLYRFFAHPFPYKPGEHFLYNSTGTNVLSAILTKVSGMSLLDYLQPRLIEPLGMGPVTCQRLKDPMAVCNGGGGMKMTIGGMARFAWFMLKDGVFDGQPLLPGWYHRQAGVKQVETAPFGFEKEWGLGYGYQCWMDSRPGSFRADGAFGQFGFVFPDLDLVLATTAATEQTQLLVDLMYHHLIPAVLEKGALKGERGSHLVLEGSIPGLISAVNPRAERELSGRRYEAEEEGMNSFETLIGGSGLFDLADAPPVLSISFSFERESCGVHFSDGERTYVLSAARDGSFKETKTQGLRIASSMRWRSLHALELEARRLDALSGVRLIFRFEGNRMLIEAEDTLLTDGGLGISDRHPVPFVCKKGGLHEKVTER